MAHNPQAPQGPEGQHDPAGNTQMFRAFVDEGSPRRPAPPPQPAKFRTGLVVGVLAALVALGAIVWLAFG